MKFCIKDFERKNRGIEIEPSNRKSHLKLYKEIMKMKSIISGSAKHETTIFIDSFAEGIDYHIKITNSRFEMIIYDICKLITKWIENSLQEISALHKNVSVEEVSTFLSFLLRYARCI